MSQMVLLERVLGLDILHLFAVPTMPVTATFPFLRAIFFLELSQAED